MKEEIWKTIPGCEKYSVSNLGRLKGPQKILKPDINKSGYACASIRITGKTRFIHRLVMKAFVGESLLDVDHIDGNKLNNCLDNLEYVSQRENVSRKENSKGYSKHRQKWISRIWSDGKSIYLGIFDTEQEALDAYNKAKLTAINKNSKGQHI